MAARRVWQKVIKFPSDTMTLRKKVELVSGSTYLATFEVPMTMNKIDIRNYLTAIYDMDVLKVNTLVQAGEWRKSPAQSEWSKGKRYRRRDYKKAYVTFYDHHDTVADALVELDRQQALQEQQERDELNKAKEDLQEAQNRNNA
jgi:ribosomal protein L23